MAKKKLSTECYLHVEPKWEKQPGDLPPRPVGIKVTKVSQKSPTKGYAIKVNLEVPAHIFKPVIADVNVDSPERAVQCKVLPISGEEA
jgi:hypothetical protein